MVYALYFALSSLGSHPGQALHCVLGQDLLVAHSGSARLLIGTEKFTFGEGGGGRKGGRGAIL